jgi:hypothetical protein
MIGFLLEAVSTSETSVSFCQTTQPSSVITLFPGEILILVFGIHLSYACRNATTQFQERRFLCLAIVVEATVSGAFYVLRIVYSRSLHPDYSFLAYFTRSQLTSTVVLLVIFTPKARFIVICCHNMYSQNLFLFD